MTDSAPAAGDGPVLFDAILHPNCSLGATGFALVMAAMTAASLVMGLFFLAHGAWPVFGYYGLDVLALWLALRASRRRARRAEMVRLTPARLTVCRLAPDGSAQSWHLQPAWLRVEMDDPPRPGSQVRLVSHGRGLIVGAFLSPAEKLDFARALRAALKAMRTPSG